MIAARAMRLKGAEGLSLLNRQQQKQQRQHQLQTKQYVPWLLTSQFGSGGSSSSFSSPATAERAKASTPTSVSSRDHDLNMHEQHAKHSEHREIDVTQTSPHHSPRRRRLDVAIVGAPNAGKSQLLNQLTRSTVAAVSRKRHTTRQGILGVRTLPQDGTQLVFWDTPGFMRAEDARRREKRAVDRDVITSAAGDMETVDYSLLVLDAASAPKHLILQDANANANAQSDNPPTQTHTPFQKTIITLMMHALESQGREEAYYDPDSDEEVVLERPVERFGIVLNKVDLVKPKTDLLYLAEDIGALAETAIEHYLRKQQTDESNMQNASVTMEDLFPSIFYTNALKAEEGIDDVLSHLSQLATPSYTWVVEDDDTAPTAMTTVERIEEIIREKIYRTLHREVPHAVAQIHKGIKASGGFVEINQELVVKSKSHHTIVAGRNLATIQQLAQRELQKSGIFPDNTKVTLHLHLKRYKGQQHSRISDAAMEGVIRWK